LSCRHMQRGGSILVWRVYIRPFSDKQFHYFPVTLASGKVQWGNSVPIRRIHVRTSR
jgi:hypothetical protein